MYTRRITNRFFYDANSIMHLYVPAMFTAKGYSVVWNADISEGDNTWAASQYPFREVPVNKKQPLVLTV